MARSGRPRRIRQRDHHRNPYETLPRIAANGGKSAVRSNSFGERFYPWIETGLGNYYLSSQRYASDIVHPDGITHLTEFELQPWPRCVLSFARRLVGDLGTKAKLSVRPFLSGRDYHGTRHENNSFHFDPDLGRDRVRWKPYNDIPAVVAHTRTRIVQEARPN